VRFGFAIRAARANSLELQGGTASARPLATRAAFDTLAATRRAGGALTSWRGRRRRDAMTAAAQEKLEPKTRENCARAEGLLRAK
jgi:hypothetical protein